MVIKATLLGAALAFALPACADNPSSATAPMSNPKGKPKGSIQQSRYGVEGQWICSRKNVTY
jgi:hypothetical protein